MAIDKPTLIAQQFGYNVNPRVNTERPLGGSSSAGGNNGRSNLLSKLDSLDGTFEKNRVNPFATNVITEAQGIDGLASTEKPQNNQSYAESFANGNLSVTDAMAILEENKGLLANLDSYKEDEGKTYELGDGEFHPVIKEAILDEVA